MMNRVELKEEMMEQVNGGRFHNHCGGEIEYSLFGECVCKKCKEHHFFENWFDSVHTKEEVEP